MILVPARNNDSRLQAVLVAVAEALEEPCSRMHIRRFALLHPTSLQAEIISRTPEAAGYSE